MKRIAMIAGFTVAGVCIAILITLFWAWALFGYVAPVHSPEACAFGLMFITAIGGIIGCMVASGDFDG